MRNACQLPVTLNPPVRTYPGYAFVLSLLFAEPDRWFPWLLNNYILTLGNSDGTRYEFLPADPFHIAEGVMKHYTISLSKEMIDDKRVFSSILSVLTAMIRRGYAMTCWMNEKYIPNRRAYQTYDFDHDNLVVGYDDGGQTLTLLGYSPQGVYGAVRVSAEQMAESLRNSGQDQIVWNFLKPNPDFLPVFDAEKTRARIRDYLESTPINALGYTEFYGLSQWVTGLSATRRLADYPVEEKGRYDIRLYSFLRDRTYLMRERAGYMMENGLVPSDEALLREFGAAADLAAVTHMLAVKYNASHQPKYTATIRENIGHIVRMEETLLPRLLDY